MAASFTFTLTPEKQNSYSRIELLVVVLHLITFIILAASRSSKGIILPVTGIVAATTYLVLYWRNKNKQSRFITMEVPMYFFAIWWFFAGVYWMGCLVFIFGLFASVYKQKIQVIITGDAVVYKSFPNRTFNWEDLNNVILKDGILTIDFKSDKIIQQLVEETDVIEAEFNLFCSTRLQAVNNKQQIV